MMVLGSSEMRAISRFNSVILANLAMHGFANSLLTLAWDALPVFSYLSYAACGHDDIEMEAMQSHFAHLRKVRSIPVGSTNVRIRKFESRIRHEWP
jgi:hypothetical protein